MSEIIVTCSGAQEQKQKERKLRQTRVERCQDENRRRPSVKKIKEFGDQNDLTFSLNSYVEVAGLVWR